MTSSADKIEAERRRSLRLLQYWELLRGGRLFPSEDELEPEKLHDVWDSCFVVQMRDIETTPDYNYSYLGNDIIKAHKTPGPISFEKLEMIGPQANKMDRHFRHVAQYQIPVLLEGTHSDSASNMTLKYRQLLLPLGKDQKVHSVFGGLWLKLFPSP